MLRFHSLVVLCAALGASIEDLPAAADERAYESQRFYRHSLVVLAEQRFNPSVQRLLAERELQALPLDGGRLFVIVPQASDAALQQVQIRSLERLLRERAE